MEHRRRQVLHFNVTGHPTAAWTSQQIVEAFAEHDAPRYLVRDRDGVYGSDVQLRIASPNRGNPHGTTQPLAESLRRTSDRLNPKRLFEPFRDPEREAPEADSGLLFQVLPRVEDSPGAGQAMSAYS